MSRDSGKQPRPPREAASTAAGEATNAGRVGSPAPEGAPPARPGQVCDTCKHLDVLHDISKTTKRRTACSVSSGPKATRCGCKTFAAATQPLT